MPDILHIKTPDWELNIWCRDISYKIAQLKKMLNARGETPRYSTVRFSDAIQIDDLNSDNNIVCIPLGETKQVNFLSPIFFENTYYEFEFLFPTLVNDIESDKPKVVHKLKSINDAFHFSQRRGLATLRGGINFANNVGWFNLPISYRQTGKIIDISLSFEVLPIKMDLQNDLNAIYQSIDKLYPLWRFSLAEKTEQDVGHGHKPQAPFPLLWLAQFEALRLELNAGIRLILNAPHSRLLPESRTVQADKLKGRLPNRLAEKIREDLNSGQYTRRYKLPKNILSIDTPENRFIKMALDTVHKCLSLFVAQIKKTNDVPDKQRLSDGFITQLTSWVHALDKHKNNIFFRDVGRFNGLSKESLVLQQKTGYSSVYRVWQQLKLYLDVLGSQGSVSMKSVAELYEVWCFLEVKLALESLGFEVEAQSKNQLKQIGLEKHFSNDAMASSYKFTRVDGITIRLAHEPSFGKNTAPVKSYLGTQRPDILLEVTLPTGEIIFWVFDAKYRIDTKGDTDYVPEDAINQMHRYRDALIRPFKSGLSESKSRPVFGAFALYPGFFDQKNESNPYNKGINEVAIGAFALLPSDKGAGRYWLTEFLKGRLGDLTKTGNSNSYSYEDKLLNEKSAQIMNFSTQLLHQNRQTLVAPITRESLRSCDFLDRARNGLLKGYHTQLIASNRQNVHRNVMREVRYIAVSVCENIGDTTQLIKYLYPVESVKLVPRSTISNDVTGRENSTNNKLFWVYSLGKSTKLDNAISKDIEPHFTFKLVDASQLEGVSDWNKIGARA